MKMSIEKNGGLLTISQRFYSIFLLYFIRITGILFATGGGIGLLGVSGTSVWNPAAPLAFFSKDLLIVNMIFTIGLAMIWAGFSSINMLRYSERIIFNNPGMRVELYSPVSAEKPLYIPYDSILNIFRFTEIRNERGRNTYSISLMLKDGAEFWVTGNVADIKKIFAIAEEISAHSGIPFTESDSRETMSQEKYSETPVPDENMQASPFLKRTDVPDGAIFSISGRKISVAGIVAAAYIYLFMITVPFFLMNIFLQQSIPTVAHYVLYFFIILWWGILTGGIIISLKDFTLKLNDSGITLVMRLKFPGIKLKEIFISPGSIIAVRTNRFENGISTLSIGLSEMPGQISKAAGMFINSSTLRTRQSTGIFYRNRNVLHLWELQPLVLPGNGPDIRDLRIIEKEIQQILGI